MSRALQSSLALALGTATWLGAAPCHADSCATVANTSAKVWNKTPPAVKTAIANSGPYGATAIQAAKWIAQGVKIWNTLTQEAGWAKIGPRRLDFDAWATGTLVGPTERMFLSAIPAVNPVTVDFHKLDHSGEVKVVICRVPEKGKATALKSFTVAPTAKQGLIKSVTVQAAKGNIISVVLPGKSATKKLKYKVRAKMDYSKPPAKSEPKKDTNKKTAPRTGDDDRKTAPR